MAAKFICDYCKKEASAFTGKDGSSFKPENWFARTPEPYKTLHACTRECVEALQKDGDKGLVAPF